jgi:hypothetical protein
MLGGPLSGRMRRHTEDMYPAGGDLKVESAWGAVSMLPPVRFPRPLAEPDVRLSPHPALHGLCRRSWFRHRTCGPHRPPPNGEAWPASALPAPSDPTAHPATARRRSAVPLAALQPPSPLESAAALRHVHGSPALGLLRRLRPVPDRSADGGPSPRTAPDAQHGGEDRDGSRVHSLIAKRGGTRLCPSGIATSTP